MSINLLEKLNETQLQSPIFNLRFIIEYTELKWMVGMNVKASTNLNGMNVSIASHCYIASPKRITVRFRSRKHSSFICKSHPSSPSSIVYTGLITTFPTVRTRRRQSWFYHRSKITAWCNITSEHVICILISKMNRDGLAMNGIGYIG